MQKWRTDDKDRMIQLMNLFPSLEGVLTTWDETKLDQWALKAKPRGKMAAQFVLSVWNNRIARKCGPFDAVRAALVWDKEHRDAFMEWIHHPWHVGGKSRDVLARTPFGSYLARKGLVTTAQVLDALDRQNTETPKIGNLGRRKAWLTQDQILQILKRQKTTRRPFGAIALEKGYLSPVQLEELVRMQAERRNVGEILVDMGALELEVMERELAEHSAKRS